MTTVRANSDTGGSLRLRCQRHQTCIRRDADNCAARECSDRQRDRNILLSKRFTRGLLKVVVARAPRDLRGEMPRGN